MPSIKDNVMTEKIDRFTSSINDLKMDMENIYLQWKLNIEIYVRINGA